MNDRNLWECTKCNFKTEDDIEAVEHEHNQLNLTCQLTDEQFERAFRK